MAKRDYRPLPLQRRQWVIAKHVVAVCQERSTPAQHKFRVLTERMAHIKKRADGHAPPPVSPQAMEKPEHAQNSPIQFRTSSGPARSSPTCWARTYILRGVDGPEGQLYLLRVGETAHRKDEALAVKCHVDGGVYQGHATTWMQLFP